MPVHSGIAKFRLLITSLQTTLRYSVGIDVIYSYLPIALVLGFIRQSVGWGSVDNLKRLRESLNTRHDSTLGPTLINLQFERKPLYLTSVVCTVIIHAVLLLGDILVTIQVTIVHHFSHDTVFHTDLRVTR